MSTKYVDHNTIYMLIIILLILVISSYLWIFNENTRYKVVLGIIKTCLIF